MTFFNKKEEVIDLVLTRRGRELLAVGKLKPAYYEFCDDEIIYDSLANRTGLAPGHPPELQNDIVDRIKSTPYIKNQNGWYETINTPSKAKKAPPLFKVLGHSSEFDHYKPAWDLKIHEGAISSSIEFTPLEFKNGNVQTFTDEKIPQIDIGCDYSVTYVNKVITPEKHELWLRKSSDDILIELNEENVEDTLDNFTLEVYKYDYNDKGIIEELIPIHFSDGEFGNQFVEYFFNVTMDADAEKSLEIKYIDQDLEKSFEKDECKVGCKPSEQEKIERLEEEIRLLKKNIEERDAENYLSQNAAQAGKLSEIEKKNLCHKLKYGYMPANVDIERAKLFGQYDEIANDPQCKKLSKAELLAAGDTFANQPCIADSDCGPLRCRQRRCDPDKPPPKPALKAVGQKCDSNVECLGNSTGKAHCDPKTKTCTVLDPKNLNKLGSVASGGKCISDAECGKADEDGTPNPNGYQMVCLDGECVVPKACFVAGTKVKMADGTDKSIEDMMKSDVVVSVDLKNMELVERPVLGLVEVVHDDIVNLEFENVKNMNTFDHPYYRVDGKLASYKPELTKLKYGLDTEQMRTGDIYYYLDNNGFLTQTKLLNIQENNGKQLTYTLIVADTHNFFANGLLVDDERIEI